MQRKKGKKPVLIEGLDQYNFAKLASSEGGARERRRFLAFAHIQDRKSFSEAARMVKVHPRTVIGWVKKFRESKIDGLREQGGRGNQPCISHEEGETIFKAVERMQQSRIGGRIRGKDVNDMIEKMYGTRLSNGSLYRLLHRVGLSWITGRSQHPKANKELQEAFKKNSETKS